MFQSARKVNLLLLLAYASKSTTRSQISTQHLSSCPESSMNINICLFLNIKPTWCTKFYNKFISSLYVFRAHVLIVRRAKLYYTASGIITPIGGCPVHQLDALNFIISLFQASTCFEHVCSSSGGQNWRWAMCPKHVQAWNKVIIKFCASSWLILINKYIEMHGQQSIKKKELYGILSKEHMWTYVRDPLLWVNVSKKGNCPDFCRSL